MIILVCTLIFSNVIVATDEEFDVTLVTYFRYSLFSGSIVVYRKRITFDPTQLVGMGLSCYFLITARAIVIVVYYRQTEQKSYSQFLELCKSRARTQCIPYVLESDTIPINKLRIWVLKRSQPLTSSLPRTISLLRVLDRLS